jgi:hypothetical protein
MIVLEMVCHAVVFAVLVNGYLLLLMVSVSPRVWGLHDYPERVRQKVPPPTRREKVLGVLLSVPFLALVAGLPFVSVGLLAARHGPELSFVMVWIHVYILLLAASALDWYVLDQLIISRITPAFVVIPGSERADYKDFSAHFRGHLRGLLLMVPLSALLAWLAG